MSTLTMSVGGVGVFELLILTAMGIGVLGVLGLLVFIAVKVAGRSK